MPSFSYWKMESLDAATINTIGERNAKRLIRTNNIDFNSSWSFSAADGNALLGPDGDNWAEYRRWFLVEETDAEARTKARYKFPFGKDGKIYRRGVIAVKSRAAQANFPELADLADELLEMIDAKKEDYADSVDPVRLDRGPSPVADARVMQGVNRADKVGGPDWMIRPFERTAEGYLSGRAVVTNIGVFPYMDGDGNVRWELRPPEEVLSTDSINSLRMKPITDDHPEALVMPSNIEGLQKGHTGSNPSVPATYTDGEPLNPEHAGFDYEEGRTYNAVGKKPIGDAYHVAIDMILTGTELIDKVLNGKQGLSAGYICDLEESSGVWMGVPYQAIQRNIRYNHVAVVDQGRAGDAARIQLKLDSADAIGVDTEKIKVQEDNMPTLKKITLDGVEYEAEPKVLENLHTEKARADKAEEDLRIKTDKYSQLEAERDTLKEKADKLQTELDEANERSVDPSKIDEAVKARISLLTAAKSAGVEVKDDMDEKAIKKAVILSVFPKADEKKLDEADDIYLNGRFDGAIEVLKDSEGRETVNRSQLTDGGAGGESKLDEAEKNYKADLTSSWERKGA
jgi:hypothetical protein